LTETAKHPTDNHHPSEGLFAFTHLKPGLYKLTIEATGFQRLGREGIRLTTGERINFGDYQGTRQNIARVRTSTVPKPNFLLVNPA